MAAADPVKVQAPRLQDSEDETPPSPILTSNRGKRKAKSARKKVHLDPSSIVTVCMYLDHTDP